MPPAKKADVDVVHPPRVADEAGDFLRAVAVQNGVRAEVEAATAVAHIVRVEDIAERAEDVHRAGAVGVRSVRTAGGGATAVAKDAGAGEVRQRPAGEFHGALPDIRQGGEEGAAGGEGVVAMYGEVEDAAPGAEVHIQRAGSFVAEEAAVMQLRVAVFVALGGVARDDVAPDELAGDEVRLRGGGDGNARIGRSGWCCPSPWRRRRSCLPPADSCAARRPAGCARQWWWWQGRGRRCRPRRC